MDKLLEKARRLTVGERTMLATKGIYLTSLDPEKDEEASLIILGLVYSDKELESLSSYEEETKLATAIVGKTYSIEEKDLKNL